MSRILDNWRKGEGLGDLLVIDGHTHVGEWPHGENFNNVQEMAQGAQTVMDANGVDAACVQAGGYMWSGTDYHYGNDVLIELMRRLPERLIPFAHVNPNDHLKDIMKELTRVCAAGMRCIKLINSYQNYPGDGPNLMALYRFADEHNMLVFNHSWSIPEITRIAQEFPKTDFVFGHYGPHQDETLRKFANVYANIWTISSLGFMERAVRNAGADKLMFGSDAFMNPISVGIGLVVYADVDEQAKRQMLGLNVARLLEKAGALPASLKRKLNTKGTTADKGTKNGRRKA